MTKVLICSTSTRNICTTTQTSQNVAAWVTEPTVPCSGRSRSSEGSRRRRVSGRRSRKTKAVKGSRAVTSEERTSGSQILHSKTRGVKFNRTRIVSCKLANGKKIVNHLRSNKNMGKSKRARDRANGSDGDTRSVNNHDGRGIGRMSRTDRREYTSVRSSVVGGPRVSDPLSVLWWSQSHGAEGLRQRGLVPPSRPVRSRPSLRRWSPVRNRASEHGRGLVRRPWPRPHGDAPRPRVGEGRPGRTSRSRRGRWSGRRALDGAA